MEEFAWGVLHNAGIKDMMDVENIANRARTVLGDMDQKTNTENELVAQYIHLREVLTTTIKLKSYMLINGMADRIFAYQTGTGFPLPAENENMIHKGFIGYGEEILEFTQKSGVAGHGAGGDSDVRDRAGFHFYEVTAENGQKATLVVLKGRYHGYESVHRMYPHLQLSLIPRVLKGIGTESILTTFASGFDRLEGDGISPKMGDYGYVVMNNDKSRESILTDPGMGEQSIVGGLFGGRFMPGPQRTSDIDGIVNLEAAIDRVYKGADYYEYKYEVDGETIVEQIPIPRRFPLIFNDATSIPNFEAYPDAVEAEHISREILKFSGKLWSSRVSEVIGDDPATAQGMSLMQELNNYYVSNEAVSQIFGRRLPHTAFAGCTDIINPEWDGPSFHTTHEFVQEQGKRSAAFFAPVVTDYFINLAAN